MCKCGDCGRVYDYRRTSGMTMSRCNSCILRRRREMIRAKTYDYKGRRCEVCGYDRCIRALHFHHRNPAEKLFKIGDSYCRSWEKIQKELDKCMLLCANCHAEIHEYLHLTSRGQTVTALA